MTTKTLSYTGSVSNYRSDTGTTSYDITIFAKQISGSNTPNFRSIRKKNLPINPYRMSGYRLAPSKFYVRNTYKDPVNPETNSTLTTINDYWLIPSAPSSELSSQAISSVNSRILNEIKSMDINLAQSMGERLQTVGLLANTASRLTRSYSHLRRGRLGSALGALGSSTFELDRRHPGASRRFRTTYPSDPKAAASSAWLEMQYGWRPLLNDVYGGAKALADFHHKRDSDIFDGRYMKKASINLNENVVMDSTLNFHANVQCGVKVTVNYALTNPLLRYSAMLGLTNPALLAWELTPFSFVVDWFLPIGKYLSNIDASYGLSFISGSRSVRYQSVSVGYYSNIFSEPYRDYEAYCQIGKNQSFGLTRTLLDDFPSNPLPQIKSPVSVSNAVSAIALLVQVFKR